MRGAAAGGVPVSLAAAAGGPAGAGAGAGCRGGRSVKRAASAAGAVQPVLGPAAHRPRAQRAAGVPGSAVQVGEVSLVVQCRWLVVLCRWVRCPWWCSAGGW